MKLPIVRMVCYVPVSLGFAVLGLGCIVTLVPFVVPFGFLALWFSGYPYARWISKAIRAEVASRPQGGGKGRGPKRAEDMYEVPAWEEGADLDEELIELIEHNGGRNAN